MDLIERDEEFSALATCQHDRGRIIIVDGPIASGKTALLHEFAEHAEATGTRLLRVAGARTERSLQFGVVHHLFSQLNVLTENSGAVTPQLKDWLSKAPLASDVYNQVSARMLNALWMELLRSSERKPLIMTIDDVHYADDSSLDCLLYFARRLAQAPVTMVLANCTRQRQANSLFLTELMRQPHCVSIHLQMLSPDGVAHLLETHLDAAISGHLAEAVYDVTGGNPLLVRALIEDCPDATAAEPGDLVPGEAFSRAVQACLNRFDPVTLRLARGIAILDMPVSLQLLGQLLDLPAEPAAAILAELGMAGLVRDGQFRHPATKTAVLSAMLPEEHAGMHGRAAQILYLDNAAATDIARHLVESASAESAGEIESAWADGIWVTAVLREAAEQAAAEGDVTFALRCLQLARRFCQSEHEYAAITSDITEVEWSVDPAIAIRHISALMLAARQGVLLGRDAAKAIQYLLWSGRPDDAIETLESATRTRSAADTEPELLATRLWIPYLYPGLSAGVVFPDGDDPPALASPQLQIARMLTGLAAGKAEEAAEYMPGISTMDGAMLALIVTAMSIAGYGEQSKVIALWSHAFLDGDGTSFEQNPPWVPPTCRALLSQIRADINIRRGNLAAAEQQAREAMEHIQPEGWGVVIGAPVALLVAAAAARGNLSDAAEYLSMPVPQSMSQTLFGPLYLNARGRYYLATGQFQSALRDFEACGAAMADWDVDRPEFIPWRLGAAEACLGLGTPQRARELVEEQPIPFGSLTRAYGMSLRVLAAASSPAERVPLLTEATEVLRECGDRFEAARAFADLSSAQLDLGKPREARVTRRRAERLAKQCGAAGLYPSLAGAGAAHAGQAEHLDINVAQLSDAERRVAALAARGFTNREIAERLYVTVSTVEQHLTRAYRKLNVNQRSDLPPWLPDVGTGTERNRMGA
jgi:DNA-binding CsgD family transcriptional regulator